MLMTHLSPNQLLLFNKPFQVMSQFFPLLPYNLRMVFIETSIFSKLVDNYRSDGHLLLETAR